MFNTVVWDAAHWIDLAVSWVKDKSTVKNIFKSFISRINSFATMFGHGRDVAEFEAVSRVMEEIFNVVQFFSTTRYVDTAL